MPSHNLGKSDGLEHLRVTRRGLWLFTKEDSVELGPLEYGGLTKDDLHYGHDVLIDQFDAENSGYMLVVVRRGEPVGDVSSTEVIVPVDLDHIRQVLDSWHEKRIRSVPDPRPRSRKR
jgi:hypothetical protein